MVEMQKTDAYSSQPRDPQHQPPHTQNLQASHSSAPQPRTAISNNLFSNPFAAMRRLMEDMEQRMFEGFGASLSRDPLQGIFEQTAWSPDLEVVKRGDHLIVRADLPGLQPNDLKVRLEDGVLSVEGERRADHASESAGIWHSERRYGKFVRKLSIPHEVRETDIKASFNNGVLEISLPAPKKSGHTIPIAQKSSQASEGPAGLGPSDRGAQAE